MGFSRLVPIVALLIAAIVLAPSWGYAQTRQELYDQATDALFNLYFQRARDLFKRLTVLEPDNPSHWTNVASTLWLEIVAGQEKLNMETFSGASLGTTSSEDLVSAEDEAELRSAVATAISKAEAVLAGDPRNVSALYYKGTAKGILAAFEAVVKRSYVKAYSAAREARALHEQVLRLSPDYRDAKLTLGLYKYTVGSVPWLLRTLLFIRGGDKQGGVADLVDVSQTGNRVRDDAKMLLIVIYNREKQYQNSLALIAELHARYPHNYLLELSKAALQSRIGRGQDSLATYASILRKIEAQQDGYHRVHAPTVLLLQAKAFLDHSQPEAGIRTYEAVLADDRSSPTDRANAHLWLGKLDDVVGRRAQAVSHYDAILSLDCKPALKEEARRYKRRPFTW